MNCLIISGLSGAGKSQAMSVLEDMGYYCVDNMPAALIPRFVELFGDVGAKYENVAFVMDVRGDMDTHGLFDTIDSIRFEGAQTDMLFLECKDEEIINRYKTTRRRHPLDKTGAGIAAAISEERALLAPLKQRADYIIDTTTLSNNDLKKRIVEHFSFHRDTSLMSINIVSFGFRYGIPHEADLVFDVRFLHNPYYVPELKSKDGRGAEVYDYVMKSASTEVFFEKLMDMIIFLLPKYQEEGKSVLAIAIGCTGGKHRSVSIARRLSQALTQKGYAPTLRHRDVDKDRD